MLWIKIKHGFLKFTRTKNGNAEKYEYLTLKSHYYAHLNVQTDDRATDKTNNTHIKYFIIK